ncbi:MAG TPA: hypothetical protein PKD55_13600 [Bellilinea sp.]|nr:hypothetical protein [Bellilinea sp.]
MDNPVSLKSVCLLQTHILFCYRSITTCAARKTITDFDYFELITRLTQETLLKQGYHIPTLIIDGTRNPIIIQIEELAPIFEGRAQQMFVTGEVLRSSENHGTNQERLLYQRMLLYEW